MSRREYQMSQRIAAAAGGEFYAVIMAAMRLADTGNLVKLREAFPEIWIELDERYNAPAGILPGDPEAAQHA